MKSTTGGSVLQGVRILVVDDDPDACDLLSTVLQVYEEAEAMTFSSVKDVLRVFRQVQPQVLISDIAMPHEDAGLVY